MKRGSITIFSALCMGFVLSALFMLLESARLYGLSQYATQKSRQGIEYAAAEYQPYLWKEFHLLMLDGGYGTNQFEIGKVTGRIKDALDTNLKRKTSGQNYQGMDFFQMEVSHIYEPEYLLITDSEGEVFLHTISEYMEKDLPKEIAEEIRQRYVSQEDIKNNTAKAEDTIEDARQSIENAKEENPEEAGKAQKIEENPLEVATEIKKSMGLSTLGLVVKEPGELSTGKMNLTDALERRTLNEGNMNYESESDWYQKILVLEYAESNFSNYCNPRENHAFSYELEYLIGGCEEERENLEAVVNRLLLYRCASNVVYLLSDREKMLQSETIAAALAGFTGNPAIIKAVQIAVVGAWAYIESIQDVRALLCGRKIAMIKSKEQWTTDLSHLLQSFQTESMAKECENGLRYEDYLKQILFFANNRKLSYRMLDVMEQNLRKTEEYRDCRMDDMIICLDYEVELCAEPLFSELSFIKENTLKQYSFRRTNRISYIP